MMVFMYICIAWHERSLPSAKKYKEYILWAEKGKALLMLYTQLNDQCNYIFFGNDIFCVMTCTARDRMLFK